MSDPNIIGHDPECYSFQDDDGKPYPALVTRGCSCCAKYRKVTPENIALALDQAREWVRFLEGLEPVEYPPEIED